MFVFVCGYSRSVSFKGKLSGATKPELSCDLASRERFDVTGQVVTTGCGVLTWIMCVQFSSPLDFMYVKNQNVHALVRPREIRELVARTKQRCQHKVVSEIRAT